MIQDKLTKSLESKPVKLFYHSANQTDGLAGSDSRTICTKNSKNSFGSLNQTTSKTDSMSDLLPNLTCMDVYDDYITNKHPYRILTFPNIVFE